MEHIIINKRNTHSLYYSALIYHHPLYTTAHFSKQTVVLYSSLTVLKINNNWTAKRTTYKGQMKEGVQEEVH